MSLIGYADLDRPVPFVSGRIFHTFGHGGFELEPSRCSVLTSSTGRVEFQLDLIRAMSERESRAVLACTAGAEYATEDAISCIREIDPAASLSCCLLTDWWFRLLPTPAVSGQTGLAAPLSLASNGLGTARLIASLSIDSGLFLEAVLLEGGSLEAVAEAQIAGVSPRVSAVVRFESLSLLHDLLQLADQTETMPRQLIVDYFHRDLATLPVDVSGAVDSATVSGFADSMADRVIARFGRYVPAQALEDAPVVQFQRSDASSSIIWSLSQPFLANRRIVLPVDLLSAARAQIDRLGADSVIHRRDMTALPPLGRSRVTAFCNLPVIRTGVDALGVTLTFPPHPPERPQAQSATAVFESNDDIAEIDVRLSPGEALRYRYSSFAVLSDESGTRQIDMPDTDGEGGVLACLGRPVPRPVRTGRGHARSRTTRRASRASAPTRSTGGSTNDDSRSIADNSLSGSSPA